MHVLGNPERVTDVEGGRKGGKGKRGGGKEKRRKKRGGKEEGMMG